MVTISQWKKVENEVQHIGNDWQAENLEKAIESVNTLKISGAGSNFVIESENGTVLEVVKMR